MNFVFLLISGSILRGAEGLSLVHALPEFRSSVPFGADASPFPHDDQGQCSSISSDKSRNAPASRAWDLPSHRVAYPDNFELVTIGGLKLSLHSTT